MLTPTRSSTVLSCSVGIRENSVSRVSGHRCKPANRWSGGCPDKLLGLAPSFDAASHNVTRTPASARSWRQPTRDASTGNHDVGIGRRRSFARVQAQGMIRAQYTRPWAHAVHGRKGAGLEALTKTRPIASNSPFAGSAANGDERVNASARWVVGAPGYRMSIRTLADIGPCRSRRGSVRFLAEAA